AGTEPEYGIATSDLNNDGNLDIVVSDFLGGTVSVLLGNGDGTFQAAVMSPAPDTPVALRVGDFNNDGVLDVALAIPGFPESYVSILFGNGDGTFQPPLSIPLSEQIDDLVVGDLNHDGKLDIVWESTISSDAHILLGNGDGTFRTGQVYGLYGTGP